MDYFNPNSVLKEIEEAKKETEKKADRRHDWIVAIFGVIGGAIAGGIVSLNFLLTSVKKDADRPKHKIGFSADPEE